mmetsp:Transcript_8413/g.29903  ORF Transcript_8413/g.29903 Transcript_8413/m.29903 type:complete len:185 (-) Transcript_8413:147-701(-)
MAGVGWQSNIMDCMNDMGTMFKGFLCPCLLAGDIGESLDESWALNCCCEFVPIAACCCGGMRRSKLRAKYNINGTCDNACVDIFCCHIGCHCCALCQEANEVKARKSWEAAAARTAAASAATAAPAGYPAAGYPAAGAPGYPAPATGYPAPMAAGPGYPQAAPAYAGAPAPQAYGQPQQQYPAY